LGWEQSNRPELEKMNGSIELSEANLDFQGSALESEITAGIRNGAGTVRRLCASMMALAVVALVADRASATFIYTWRTTSGSILSASFQVVDSAVADGVISASEMSMPPGFSADSAVGVFTNLTADSAIVVNPVTGAVVASTYGLTATNSKDTLVVGVNAFYIPTSNLSTQGRGNWRVTHLAEIVPPLHIAVVGITNQQVHLLVTSSSNTSFSVEASGDLMHWAPIATNVTVDGANIVTDLEPAVAAARFYRAVIKN
jgi:hypothetical protein